jgi:hypothetical protein
MTTSVQNADALLASGWLLLEIGEDYFLLGRTTPGPIYWKLIDANWRKVRNLPPPAKATIAPVMDRHAFVTQIRKVISRNRSKR